MRLTRNEEIYAAWKSEDDGTLQATQKRRQSVCQISRGPEEPGPEPARGPEQGPEQGPAQARKRKRRAARPGPG